MKQINKPHMRVISSKLTCSSLSLLFLLLASQTMNVASSFSSSQQMADPERPSQHYQKFFDNLPSMEGKTVVITGCSQGLGYVTASTVAKKGGFVILLNRASERSKQSFDSISKDAVGPPPRLIDCDLLSFESVREACEQVRESTRVSGIDVLCCNAGIMLQEDKASTDGYDITASTNMLSHFLLAKELFSELTKASAINKEARIVTMSSMSGYGAPAFNPTFFERRGGNLGGSKASNERYHQSKVANLAFTAALDDKLRATNSRVKAISCTPGICGTNMFVHAITEMRGRPAPRNTVPSTEDGSLAQLKCIFDQTVESGDLWGPKYGNSGELEKTIVGPPMILVDQDSKNAVWKVCEEAVGLFNV